MVEQGRGRGEDSDRVSSPLWGEFVELSIIHETKLLGVDTEGIRADAYMKNCSRLCNHKGIAPTTAVGCRLWYTMVCEGGHLAIDQYYPEGLEEVWVNLRFWT